MVLRRIQIHTGDGQTRVVADLERPCLRQIRRTVGFSDAHLRCHAARGPVGGVERLLLRGLVIIFFTVVDVSLSCLPAAANSTNAGTLDQTNGQRPRSRTLFQRLLSFGTEDNRASHTPRANLSILETFSDDNDFYFRRAMHDMALAQACGALVVRAAPARVPTPGVWPLTG